MATDSPALDFAFGPRPQRQIDPIVAIMAQNFANQAGQRRQAENALALQAQNERAADERQALALAAQERAVAATGKQAIDTRLALEEADAKNKAAAVAKADENRTLADIEKARNAAMAIGETFDDDPEKPMAVRGAKARAFVAKANAKAYDQKLNLVKKNEKEIKDLEKQLDDEAQAPITISNQSLNAAAASNPGIVALLSKDELAKLASGTLDTNKLDDSKKLFFSDMMEKIRKELVEGEQVSRVMRLRALQERQRAATSRSNVDNMELQRMGSQFEPYNLFSRPVENAPDSGIGEYGYSIGAEPEQPQSTIPSMTSEVYPDDRQPESPVAIPSPSAAAPMPAAIQPQAPAAALDGIGAPYANMIYGDPRQAQQSDDYATLNRLTKFPGYGSVLPVFRDPALGGYSWSNIGRERGFSPEGLSNLVATAGAANVRPGTGLKSATTGAIMTQQQLMAAREIAKRLLGIVDQPERPSYTLDISNPDVFEPATIPNELAISPMR